ncbi:MAG: WD40 repeat domain-containing protein [Bacteroidia bacterium]
MHLQFQHRFAGHQGSIYALVKGQGEGIFYSGAGDKIVAQWDLHHPGDGILIAKATDSIYCMHFLPEQNRLLIGQGSGGLHIIDLSENKEERLLKLHDQAVFAILSNNKHKLIFTLGGDGILCVLNDQSFEVIQRIRLSEKKLRAIVINKNQDKIFVGCGDGSIVELSLPSLKITHRFQAHGVDFSVNALCFSPDETKLLSGSRDAHLNIFRLDNYELISSIPAHNFAIYDIAFDPTGNYFATASRDKSVKIWDYKSFSVLERLEGNDGKGHINSVNKLLWLEDGTLLSAGDDRAVQSWKK